MSAEQTPPERPRDWLDDIFDSGTTPPPQQPRQPAASPPPPSQDPPSNPWWSVAKPSTPQGPPDPSGQHSPLPGGMPPGVHITFTPPTPPPPPTDPHAAHRRARARRWLLVHGAAAGTGWTFGLYHSIDAFLGTLGPGAPAAGLALAAFSWVGAGLVTERIVSRYVPTDQLRAAAAWACRIPFATALLATALHAPNPVF